MGPAGDVDGKHAPAGYGWLLLRRGHSPFSYFVFSLLILEPSEVTAQLWEKPKSFPILKHHVTHHAWDRCACTLQMLDRPHLVLADYELCRRGEILTLSMCPAHGTLLRCVIPETASQWSLSIQAGRTVVITWPSVEAFSFSISHALCSHPKVKSKSTNPTDLRLSNIAGIAGISFVRGRSHADWP